MKRRRIWMWVVLPLVMSACTARPPEAAREMRGVWVASVANIDWPSQRGLAAAEQQREALAILDRAAELNLNVVILQVRTACDALYASEIEPWSEWWESARSGSTGRGNPGACRGLTSARGCTRMRSCG